MNQDQRKIGETYGKEVEEAKERDSAGSKRACVNLCLGSYLSGRQLQGGSVVGVFRS